MPVVPPAQIALIRDASRRLVRELGFMNATLAGTDLHPSAVHALLEIDAKGPLTSMELSELLTLEKSSVSRMIRKLIDRGELTERISECDARAKPLALTRKGRATLAAINSFAQRQVVAALSKLSAEDRRTVAAGLAAYAAALQASRTGQPPTAAEPAARKANPQIGVDLRPKRASRRRTAPPT